MAAINVAPKAPTVDHKLAAGAGNERPLRRPLSLRERAGVRAHLVAGSPVEKAAPFSTLRSAHGSYRSIGSQ